MSGLIQKYHVSKQLFDKDNDGLLYEGYTLSNVGQWTKGGSGTVIRIPIEGNKIYTMSGEVDSNIFRVAITSSDSIPTSSSPVETEDKVRTGVPREITFSAGEGTKYLLIQVSLTKVNDYRNVLMLNEGPSALPYDTYGNRWNDTPYRRYETATDVVTNLPVTVYGDGETNISLLLKGNTETSGNPSPQNPVTVEGVGEETANLLNPSILANGYTLASDTGLPVESAQRIATLTPINIPQGTTSIRVTYNSDNATFMYSTFRNGTMIERVTSKFSGTEIILNNIDTIYFSWYKSATTVTTSDVTDIMVSIGSDTVPYEPYGKYKISILKDLQPLTPVYLTEQLMKIDTYSDSVNSSGTVTYNIKKLVFTGAENWQLYTVSSPLYQYDVYQFYTSDDTLNLNGLAISSCLSNIAPYGMTATTRPNYNCGVYLVTSGKEVAFQMEGAKNLFPNVTAWKQFLTDQYAAGTPVTVYYFLATPTTESVTAPEITTTGGEVSIDVNTTVKPSELELTYHGWHTHEPLKRENGQWV